MKLKVLKGVFYTNLLSKFYGHCEVSFGLSFVHLAGNAKADILIQLACCPEAVVFKKTWMALLSAEKIAPQRRVKFHRNNALFI